MIRQGGTETWKEIILFHLVLSIMFTFAVLTISYNARYETGLFCSGADDPLIKCISEFGLLFVATYLRFGVALFCIGVLLKAAFRFVRTRG